MPEQLEKYITEKTIVDEAAIEKIKACFRLITTKRNQVLLRKCTNSAQHKYGHRNLNKPVLLQRHFHRFRL
jgi:hypothetical protein